MQADSQFVELKIGEDSVQIEYRWVSPARTGTGAIQQTNPPDNYAPFIVFLHEGLGSVSQWRDFPQAVTDATGCPALVYSRPGYGQSTSMGDQRWGVDFLHQQAKQVLPALFSALEIDAIRQPPCLLGHSDGASIALIYAACFPDSVRSVIAMAPHWMVESVTVANIAAADDAYWNGNLRPRLSRHHKDPDAVFRAWASIWLKPEFRDWQIADELGCIRCPVLAIQGQDDEYGTMEQIHGVARTVPDCVVMELPACGHSPQRDQPDAVIASIQNFLHAR